MTTAVHLAAARVNPIRAPSISTRSAARRSRKCPVGLTRCGWFVTRHRRPTITMTVTFLRAGLGRRFVVMGGVLKLSTASAVLSAELVDEQGRQVATVSGVSQLLTDLSRLA